MMRILWLWLLLSACAYDFPEVECYSDQDCDAGVCKQDRCVVDAGLVD